MDLMGPIQVEMINGKKYVFVFADDFSRYTWVEFIREKLDTFSVFKVLCKRLQIEKISNIGRIRSDHGREFENSQFYTFYNKYGIVDEFSGPKTPQQNG